VILVDTSVWVEYDRATGSSFDRHLTDLIATDGELAVTEPVLMEVVAGARDDRRARDLRRLLLRFAWLPFDAAVDSEAAALVYRRCRRAGVTPRGMVDCLIASVALRHGTPLLAADADLHRVASVIGLALDEVPASPA
jgi:predicted nucleic acid-binding protein